MIVPSPACKTAREAEDRQEVLVAGLKFSGPRSGNSHGSFGGAGANTRGTPGRAVPSHACGVCNSNSGVPTYPGNTSGCLASRECRTPNA
jgi:hypothetical protein